MATLSDDERASARVRGARSGGDDGGVSRGGLGAFGTPCRSRSATSLGRTRSPSRSGLFAGRGMGASTPDLHAADKGEGLRSLSLDAAAGSELLRHRLQEIVDDELGHERARQVSDFTAKVSALEWDRQKAREDLEATERQYQALIAAAREQLSQLQADQEVMRNDIAQLEEQLRESMHARASDHERHERALAAESARAEADVRRLSELRCSHGQHVDAARMEVAELRSRLESLQAEKAHAQEESLTVRHTMRTLRDSLDEAKRQLDESEQRRAVLRERYLNAGEQFEHSVERSEQESQLIFAELQADVRRSQQKYDKYKQRVESVEAEIRSAEANLRAQQALLNDKAAEAAHLQRAVEAERTTCGRQELRYLQRANSRDLIGPAEQMIAVSVHQKQLEDQARHFRERMQELDKRLKLEMEAASRAISADRDRSRGSWRTPPPSFPAAGGAVASPARQALSRASRAEAARRTQATCESLEAELWELRQSRMRTDATIARTEEQRRTLAESLQDASSHLERLQRIVDDEQRAERMARSDVDELNREAAEAQSELESRSHRLIKLRGEVGDTERLCAVVDECSVEAAALEEAREKLRQECHEQQLELATVEGERRAYVSKLEAAERHEELSEWRCSQGEAKLQQVCDALRRAQLLAKLHARDARCSVEQLRANASSELRRLRDHCQKQVEQFCLSFVGKQRHVKSEEVVLERASQDATRRGRYLAEHMDAEAAEANTLENRLERARCEASRQHSVRKRLQAILGAQTRGVERWLNVASAAMPDAKDFDEIRRFALGPDGPDDASLPDLLAALRTGLARAHELARTNEKTAGQENSEALVRGEEQREASAMKRRREEVRAELVEVECRRDDLAAELEQRQTQFRLRSEDCSARYVASEREVALHEARLQSVQLQAEERDMEATEHTNRLQTLRIEAALSAELSMSDAVESLKLQLYDQLAEVDELQRKFQQELRELERSWTVSSERDAEGHDTEIRELKEHFREASEQLRLKIGAERIEEVDANATEARVARDLAEELAERRQELADQRARCRALQDECETAAKEESQSQAAAQATEDRVAQAQRQRASEQGSFAERRSELLRNQEREVAETRRAKDGDISMLRARLSQTLSGLSEVAPDMEEPSTASGLGVTNLDISGAAFSVSIEPTFDIASDPLAARARRHLGLPSPRKGSKTDSR